MNILSPCNSLVIPLLGEEYVKSIPPDDIYEKDALTEDALEQRKLLKYFGLDIVRILLGAV
jgi:hypothetical protein